MTKLVLLGTVFVCAAIISLYNWLDAKAKVDKAKVEFTYAVKVGKTLDAAVIPTSYNETTKTQVRTEQASIVIEGARSILLGRESFVKMSADRTEKRFCVGVEEECYKMY